MPSAPHQPFLIAISGPSSSGKTTLSRLLRDIFTPLSPRAPSPSTSTLSASPSPAPIYRPEEQLPFRAGVRDWDCAAAIDIPALVQALEYVRREGRSPEWLVSKEDGNAVGPSGVAPEVVGELKSVVRDAVGEGMGKGRGRRVVIVDGFLLLGESVKEVRQLFDLRVLLRADYESAKRRREARKGYVTLEGFWEDPPGYVDDVVWPGFVEEHGFLFEGGDVEGKVDEEVVKRLDVRVCPGMGKWTMEEVLRWSVGVILMELKEDGM
jgi:nicotinamide/nicotinate riboside kinase